MTILWHNLSPRKSDLHGRLIAQLLALRESALRVEHDHEAELATMPARHVPSARNLLHYLALRQFDIRELQTDLASLGLSSLGRCEAHTLATLESVLRALDRLARSAPVSLARPTAIDFESGPARLVANAARLFGPPRAPGTPSVMVTMPTEAADDPQLVEDLVRAGTDVIRINCAHDDTDVWLRIIKNLRRACKKLGRRCRVAMDLAGPKLRTGELAAGPSIIKIRPERDGRGRVVDDALLWLTPADAPEKAPPGAITVTIRGLAAAGRSVEQLELDDTRGKHRKLRVLGRSGHSLLCASRKTVYIENGTTLRWRGRRGQAAVVAGLPAPPQPIELHPGDRLIVTKAQTPGRGARPASNGVSASPARVPCTLPAIFDCVKPRQRIWFDDGKVGGVVVSNNGHELGVTITDCPVDGVRLLADKGINLPDTDLDLPGLTRKDLRDLRFAARHADMVAMSFVHRPEDITRLVRHIRAVSKRRPGIILKIETRRAFDSLPRLLLAGLQQPRVGVMVARGDLAIEVGFERLAEIQEEILWLCEAAHVPVIWATQVLETLAKKGAPARAEVTDAAMSARAECVMLNKGPFIVRAVTFLHDVFARMRSHVRKKRTMLRRLSVASRA